MLPTFLVIGAQKSGTSSLWRYMQGHPQVFITLRSEPAYFSGHNFWRGLDWYENQFRGSERCLVRGESSPQYAMYPTFRNVPERIASLVPSVKLIYVVRHPVERMRSHYHHRFAAGVERSSIEHALREEPHYLNTSRYAMQIDQYMRYFDRSQLLVVVSEDLRTHRRDVLREIFAFLEVDEQWWSPELDTDFNVSVERRLRRPVVQRVMTHDAALRVAQRIPPTLKQSIRTVSHRSPPTAQLSMSEGLERELEEALRDDVTRLRRYLPVDFDGWGIA